ncbi:MAG: phosphate ABC transporter substrate-binding protein [Burkholderiaceae bacterium]|nr:phosphate ABC transporter substrate-binding protein [Burkholderiaceae bacterium]
MFHSSVLVAALFSTGLASAGDLIVIANANVALTADEIREVFVGDKQNAGGVKLVPLDNSAAQADFLAKVIKVDSAKYASIWAKKGFREGINPPAVRGSDMEVISAVKSTPGAVGYVSKAPADVKVLQKY